MLDAFPETLMAGVAADRLGYASMRLPSGVGHDAVYMAPTGPIGMIFFPARTAAATAPRNGSNRLNYWTARRVLYQTILELDRKLRG